MKFYLQFLPFQIHNRRGVGIKKQGLVALPRKFMIS